MELEQEHHQLLMVRATHCIVFSLAYQCSRPAACSDTHEDCADCSHWNIQGLDQWWSAELYAIKLEEHRSVFRGPWNNNDVVVRNMLIKLEAAGYQLVDV